jgi:hypothetical protein
LAACFLYDNVIGGEKKLNSLRNDFILFVPKGWAVDIWKCMRLRSINFSYIARERRKEYLKCNKF